MEELYLGIVQRNTAVASSHTCPTNPHSLQLSAHSPTEQPVLLSHTRRHQWLTAGRTGAQLVPLVTTLVPTSHPGLTVSGCSKLRISLPGLQSQPHSAAAFHKLLLLPHTCQILTKSCFLAGTLKLNLLFHCLNHWNEYTPQPKNSCLREAAATKLCQQWHTTQTQAVEAAQQ